MRRALTCLCATVLAVALSITGAAFASPDAPDTAPAAATGMREMSGIAASVGGSLSGTAVKPSSGSSVAGSGGVSSSAVAIFSNDLEGPGTWWVTGGPANWGLTSYRKSNGAMSMYCAQTARPAPGPYLNNSDTWMVAGPFNLSNYSSAVLNFDVWMNVESDDYYVTDFLFAGASTDAVNFYGDAWDGYSNGWQNVSVSLLEFCGQSNVYIGFWFSSDDTVVMEGAYIDHVSLWAEPVPVNYPPVANGDTYAATQNKTKSVAAPGVLGNDTDANGDSLSASAVTLPAHGTLSLSPSGGFDYTPSPGYLGPDSFTYRASDGKVNSNTATVNINVAADAPPVANDDSFSLVKDTSKVFPAPGVLANDTDANGDTLTAIKVSDASHGAVFMEPSGRFTYMCTDTGYTGTDSFTYKANDGVNDSAVKTVTINIIESPPMNVYRFYNNRAGTHFYTANEAEKANIMATLAGTYSYEGVAYTLQPANCPTPLYRFYRYSSGTHFFTADESEKQRVQSTMSSMYGYEGVAYGVSSHHNAFAYPPVYRFFRPSTGTHFYTADEAEKNRVLSTMGHLYSYDGIAFYLGQ